MEFKFTNINISEYEKFWLKKIVLTINNYRQKCFIDYEKKIKNDLKVFKSKGFDKSKINKLLLKYNHITLLGLRYITPEDDIFKHIESIIYYIRQKIQENFNDKGDRLKLKVTELTKTLNIPEHEFKYAIFLLKDLGYFSDCGKNIKDCNSIDLSKPYICEKYLNYNSLDEIIENFFNINSVAKHEGIDIFFNFITNIIKTISKKEVIYLAFISGIVWLGLYLFINKIPFPNNIDNLSLLGVALGFSISLLIMFIFIIILYYPLYNFLIDDELRIESIKEENYITIYFFNLGTALIFALIFFAILFMHNSFNRLFSSSERNVMLPLFILFIIFIIYPLFKNYLIPKVILIFNKNFNIWKKPWYKNILTFFTDGIFFLIILLIVSLTFDTFVSRNHINIGSGFSCKSIEWFSLYITFFTFIIISMNIIIGKYIIDKRKKYNEDIYSESFKTFIISIFIGFIIIYFFSILRIFNLNIFINNTFQEVHIGSYYSQFVINNNYFEKIKRKDFLNSDLFILNKLSCRHIKPKKNNSKHPNYYKCDFKLTNISKNKKYYFAEYSYGQYEKPQFSKLNLPKNYIKPNNKDKKNKIKIKKLLKIKFNKILFQNYLKSLKYNNAKESQIKLVRNIIVNNATTAPSYCYIGAKSTICKFLVLLNLGSNYVVRINNNIAIQDNKQKSQNFSIITIPKKYVLSTRLNLNFNKLK